MGVPRRGELGARHFARQGDAFRRPCLEALAQQRQVEQPFARIIDDVQREFAHRAGTRLIFDQRAATR